MQNPVPVVAPDKVQVAAATAPSAPPDNIAAVILGNVIRGRESKQQ
jgi:hypothetical protein